MTNQPPVAVDDSETTPLDTPVTLSAIVNDSDPDGTVDVATVDLDPITLGRQTTATIPGEGTFTADNLGNVTFTPEAGFTGVSMIDYTVQDDLGATSNVATITITISALPPTPLIGVAKQASVADRSVTLNFRIENFGNVPLSNISLIDDLDTTFGAGTYTAGAPTIATPPATSTMAVNAAFTGSGAGAELLDMANSALAVGEFAIISVTVTVNMLSDQGNGLGVYQNNAIGAGDPPSGPGDRVSDEATAGTDPDPNGNGNPTDPPENEGPPVIISLAPQPPVAVDDSGTTPFNTPVTLPVTSNDFDLDGTIDVATVDLDPDTSGRQTSFTVTGQGTYTADDLGNVTFTPVTGFSGVSTTPYIVQDNDASTSNRADITITVLGPGGNQPPVAVNDSETTPLDTPVTLSAIVNDSDPDGTVDPATVDLDPDTTERQTTFTVEGQGTFTADDLGNVTFTPEAGYTGVSMIDYIVQDDDAATSNVAKIEITVLGPGGNLPPVAVMDSETTPLDTPVTLSAIANDVDRDGTIDPATVDLDPDTPGRQTTFTVTGQGTYTADDLGNVTFTPETGFIGVSTIDYTVQDNLGSTSNVAPITITVSGPAVGPEPENEPPVAGNDSETTPLDTPVTLSAIVNDSDPDGAVDPATVDLDPATPGRQTSIIVPNEGTYTADDLGNVTFTPLEGFGGISMTTYTVQDDDGALSNIATITILVGSTNVFDPPAGIKIVNPVGLPELEWRMVWINNGNLEANKVQITDDIPDGTTYVPDSLTCEPRGASTVDQCVFEAAMNRVLYLGDIAADFGALTEAEAANEVVITYRVAVPLGFFGTITNQAQANWDTDGNGTPDNEVSNNQPPVLTDDATTAEPGDPTESNIPAAPGCLFQVRSVAGADAGGGEEEEPEEIDDPDEGGAIVAGVDPRGTPVEPGLTTPLSTQVVAGSAVAVAAIQGPGQGTVIFPTVRVTVANTDASVSPDIMEEPGLKFVLTTAQQEQTVVTSSGVVAVLPANALPADETLEIVGVDTADAPAPLPGVLAAGLWRLETLNAVTQFDVPATLCVPYNDADQNGRVDDSFGAMIDEVTLTLWFFDPAQGWLSLPEAILIPELNVVVVETDRVGLFGIFQATDGRVGTVGDVTDDIAFITPLPSPDAAPSTAPWQDIGVDITVPYVTAWDTTQLVDGDYELRAVCAEMPADLVSFQSGVPSGSSSSGGSDCFIATAAYGAPWTPQVRILRDFRDRYLLPNAPGRWVVAQYYRLSPPLANMIRDRAWLRSSVRLALTPVVWMVQAVMYISGWWMLAFAALSAGVGWSLYRARHRYI